MNETMEKLSLTNKVFVITGGAGLLGRQHAAAILEAGGRPVILDIDTVRLQETTADLKRLSGQEVLGLRADITKKEQIIEAKDKILATYGRIDGLVNNAANNPKVEAGGKQQWHRFEDFPETVWDDDLGVGLKGAFFCAQVFGGHLAKQGHGTIINISSDLGLIAPDQRIYRKPGLPEEQQMIKPVSYSVAKHGLIGLTRYLATYWADHGVRVNALCPSGVSNNQEEDFVKKFSNLVPLGRMAKPDEYRVAIVFLLSEASSYMTGSVLVMDGGKTVW